MPLPSEATQSYAGPSPAALAAIQSGRANGRLYTRQDPTQALDEAPPRTGKALPPSWRTDERLRGLTGGLWALEARLADLRRVIRDPDGAIPAAREHLADVQVRVLTHEASQKDLAAAEEALAAAEGAVANAVHEIPTIEKALERMQLQRARLEEALQQAAAHQLRPLLAEALRGRVAAIEAAIAADARVRELQSLIAGEFAPYSRGLVAEDLRLRSGSSGSLSITDWVARQRAIILETYGE